MWKAIARYKVFSFFVISSTFSKNTSYTSAFTTIDKLHNQHIMNTTYKTAGLKCTKQPCSQYTRLSTLKTVCEEKLRIIGSP